MQRSTRFAHGSFTTSTIATKNEELYEAQADRHQWKNLADDTRFAAAKANLKKWLPKTNAEHFRGNVAGDRSEAGEKRPGKKTKSTAKTPVRAASGSARRSAVCFDAYSSTQ
jgi:hypothetical protein